MAGYLPPSTLALAACLALVTRAALAAETCAELMQKGDVFYDRLQAKEALSFYLPAEKLEPQNSRLLTRISREYRHLMSDASSNSEKLKLGNTALDYAKKAVSCAPSDPDAQLAIAICYGKLMPLQGNREKVENSRKVKAAADKVIALDPSNDLAWHVRGRWSLVLAETNSFQKSMAAMIYGKLPEATFADAERDFKKAIALNPSRLMHYIELGRTYYGMGQKAEAKKYIKKGLAMRETEKDDPETKEKGRELLRKLE